MPLAQLSRDAERWLIGSFVVLLLSGVPQAMSTALKQYYSPFFWWKMQVLFLGLVFTFTIRRKVALAGEERLGSVWPKLVGLVSQGGAGPKDRAGGEGFWGARLLASVTCLEVAAGLEGCLESEPTSLVGRCQSTIDRKR